MKKAIQYSFKEKKLKFAQCLAFLLVEILILSFCFEFLVCFYNISVTFKNDFHDLSMIALCGGKGGGRAPWEDQGVKDKKKK